VQDKDVQMQVEQPAQPAEAPDHAAAPDQGQLTPLFPLSTGVLTVPDTPTAADTPAVPEGFVPYTESTTSILFAAPPSSSSQAGSAPVFLNPVQQYNRDLSVVAIRTWSEARQREKRAFWEEGLRRKRERKRAGGAGADGKGKGKKRKAQDGEGVEVGAEADKAAEAAEAKRVEDKVRPSLRGSHIVRADADSARACQAPEPAGEPASETAAAPAPKGDEPLPPAPTYKFSLLEALSATGLRAIRYAKELPLLKCGRSLFLSSCLPF